MKHLYLVDGTDYVWAESEDKAVSHWVGEVDLEPSTIVQLPDDKPVYVYKNRNGENLWWFKYWEEEGHVLEREETVQSFFSKWCEGLDSYTVYSTEW